MRTVGDFLLEGGPEFFDDGRAFFALTKEAQDELGVLNAGLTRRGAGVRDDQGIDRSFACAYAPALGERLMGLLDRELGLRRANPKQPLGTGATLREPRSA